MSNYTASRVTMGGMAANNMPGHDVRLSRNIKGLSDIHVQAPNLFAHRAPKRRGRDCTPHTGREVLVAPGPSQRFRRLRPVQPQPETLQQRTRWPHPLPP